MRSTSYRHSSVLVLCAVLCGGAWAQYKIVAPDGRITYTDRPPVDTSVKVTDLGRPGAPPPAASPQLPANLQRLSDRFPVTLFTGSDCAPCDGGRQLLTERGVPYVERLVLSNDDIAALERTVGGRTLPALTVGGQALRGFSSSEWASYLDAAGYPRDSRLPPGWTPATPQPLVARAATPATRPAEASAEVPTTRAAPEPALPAADPDGSGIRF